MIKRVANYLRGLAAYVGEHWNRFWFEPTESRDLGVLRIAMGTLALLWQLSFTADLATWFGPTGWLDAALVRQWIGMDATRGFSGRLSYLYIDVPAVLWGLHWASSLILLGFTLGFATRLTSILALGVVLAYVHRAPFLGGAAEPVLTMVVAYLCLAPSGTWFSVDGWRRTRTTVPARRLSSWTTISRRLIQVHLVLVYLVMVSTKLAGVTWWSGEAIWWLAVQPSAGALDPTFLRDQPIALNLWTFAILLSQASFPVLVWNAWLRPIGLGFAGLGWISLGVITGTWGLPATMIVAGLAFVGSPSPTRPPPDLTDAHRPVSSTERP